LKIVAKSGCSIQQLEDRIHKGFKYLELQLSKEFVENKFNIHDYNHLLDSRWDVQSIHMPLIPDGDEFNMEYLGATKYAQVFFQTCKLAQTCADYYEHPITIVIHCGLPLNTLLKMPDSLTKIESMFTQALEYYKDVNFSIENIPAFGIKNNVMKFKQNCFTENVEIAQYFNKQLCTDSFHTTLDICHYLMTQLSMQFVLDFDKWKFVKRDLDFYFRENKDTINNIHLNNIREIGILKMNHGASFDASNQQDMDLLDEVFHLYQKYHYSCNLTLEVDEEDYLNIHHAQKLKKLIEQKYPLVQIDR
jgi:hypothetical protein